MHRLLVAAIALPFFGFGGGFAATVGRERTANADAFLELTGWFAPDVAFGFAGVD